MVSARSARRPLGEAKWRRQSAQKMLITLSPALQLSLGVSDCEWLSHCGALHHSHRAATGTKGGSSCRFKKDVFSTACEAAVWIIFFFFFFFPICAVIEKLLQMYCREQCCQSIRLSVREVKKRVSAVRIWV